MVVDENTSTGKMTPDKEVHERGKKDKERIETYTLQNITEKHIIGGDGVK